MPLKSYKICSKFFEHGNDPPPFWTMFKKTAELVTGGTPNSCDSVESGDSCETGDIGKIGDSVESVDSGFSVESFERFS